MKKLYLSILIIIALLAFPATALADSELEAGATLNGSQEVPPNGSAMRGNAEIEIENGKLKAVIRVRNNTNDIFAAHIHCAPPGVNGPVGVTLFMGSFTAERGRLVRVIFTSPDAGNGCGWTSIADVAAAIQSGNAYVNVHTTAASGGIPSGEIRGNLSVGND
jgi:hypothetical protein